MAKNISTSKDDIILNVLNFILKVKLSVSRVKIHIENKSKIFITVPDRCVKTQTPETTKNEMLT